MFSSAVQLWQESEESSSSSESSSSEAEAEEGSGSSEEEEKEEVKGKKDPKEAGLILLWGLGLCSRGFVVFGRYTLSQISADG